jgi:hypothetical protein
MKICTGDFSRRSRLTSNTDGIAEEKIGVSLPLSKYTRRMHTASLKKLRKLSLKLTHAVMLLCMLAVRFGSIYEWEEKMVKIRGTVRYA